MIAIRVLQGGVPVREHVVRDLPVRVGRGPDNDVVLFDPSVSRRHALVEQDPSGELVVRDRGSRNGIHLGPRVVGEAHGNRVRCFLGKVEIEVERLSGDDTLPVAVDDRAVFEHRRTGADHVRYAVLGILAWLAMALLDGDFWSPWQQNRTGTLIGHVLGAAIGLPLAAFVLLGVLRVAGRAVRIADTLRALAIVMAVLLAVEVAQLLLYYVLPPTALRMMATVLGTATTVWVVVFLAGLRRRGGSPWFRLAWAATTLLLVAGLQYTTSLAQRRAGLPDADHTVRPPVAGLSGPRRDLDDYMAAIDGVTADRGREAAAVEGRHAASRRSNPVRRPD